MRAFTVSPLQRRTVFAEIFPLYEGIDPGRCGADPNGRINGRRLKGGNSMALSENIKERRVQLKCLKRT